MAHNSPYTTRNGSQPRSLSVSVLRSGLRTLSSPLRWSARVILTAVRDARGAKGFRELAARVLRHFAALQRKGLSTECFDSYCCHSLPSSRSNGETNVQVIGKSARAQLP